ncbi:MAG: lipocalin family protein [Terrimicrobiaceae bacterium]
MKAFIALFSLLTLAACSTMPKQPPLKTVDHVDMQKFMGPWYVIGTIPWIVEKNNVGTMDIYEPRKDGKIDIRYVFHKKSLDAPRQEWKAVGRVVDTKTNARWAIQFIWPFEAPYLVLALSPDYQQTVIGHPSRDLVWIMSRKPVMSDQDFEKTVRDLAAQGYDPKRIVRVPQKADAAK